MEARATLLGGLTPREFLARHWQKAPLVVRRALPGFVPPFGPGEARALACDPAVPSRLVVAPRDGAGWTTRRGPLDENDLAALPADGWTVILHEMDRRFASLAALLERFRFVPNWRIDDVMVSYAADGGGVGPHVDRYDVFLLQAAGRRRWSIGAGPVEDARVAAGSEHAVLERFAPATEHVLEPGDVLYLPPRVAHDGVALGECMTCSIGFRAPDPRELCAGYLRQLGPQAFEAIRYADPDLEPAAHAGEIPAAARRRLRDAAAELFARPDAFDHWLGRFVTAPARGPLHRAETVVGADGLVRLLAGGGELVRSAPSHFAWYRGDDAAVHLFVGGEAYRLDPGAEEAAERLCGRERLAGTALASLLDDRQIANVLHELLLRGHLFPRG